LKCLVSNAAEHLFLELGLRLRFQTVTIGLLSAVACWDNIFSSVQWGYWEIASTLSIHLIRGCTEDLAMIERLAATPGTRAKLARKTLKGDESPLARQPD
jgi:hypothetical protein